MSPPFLGMCIIHMTYCAEKLQWLLFLVYLLHTWILLSIMIIQLRNPNPREPTASRLLWLSCGWKELWPWVKQYTHTGTFTFSEWDLLVAKFLNPRHVWFGLRGPDLGLRAAPVVLNMWPQKLKLDGDASSALLNCFGPAFLHSLLRLVKGADYPTTCHRKP
jgi:hypothetical protein